MLAQHPHDPLAPVAIAVAFVRGVLGHAELTGQAVQAAVLRGTLQGRQAAPLFGIDWSQHWHRPLAEVRRELGLERPSLAPELRVERPLCAAV